MDNTELVEAIIERYRSSCRADKQRILDEFVAVTGYHRKYAGRYGPVVRDALIALWEASDRLCSKRLKPLIPILLPAFERHGRLDLSSELRDKLLTVSATTMDRLPSEIRVAARGGQRQRTGMSSAVRRSAPVRTFGDWNDPLPGYVEVDFVAHSGTFSSDSFVQTMVRPMTLPAGPRACQAARAKAVSLSLSSIRPARCFHSRCWACSSTTIAPS